MKFRTKLILGFSIVIFFISAILGIVCYNYNSKRLSEKATQSLKFYSRQTAANVDFTVDSMKHVTDYILSDPDMLNAMKTLPKYYGSSTYSKTIPCIISTAIFTELLFLTSSEMWRPVPIPVPRSPTKPGILPLLTGWILRQEDMESRFW